MSESVWRRAARAAGSPNLRASDSDRDRTRRSESVASCLDNIRPIGRHGDLAPAAQGFFDPGQ